jgi:hypothetical protein
MKEVTISEGNMSTVPIYRLGVDPGFGNFKVSGAHDGRMLTTCLVSVVGVGSTEMGLLDALPGQHNPQRNLPEIVNFDGITYLVGAEAAQYTRQISQRLDFQRLADSPELRALLYVALWRLLGAGMHAAVAIIGLPVEVMQQKELAQQTLGQLQDWLINRHDFSVNNDIVSVTITAVKVVAQPAGAYFDWGLDEAGNWQRSSQVLDSPVVVVDGGYNTVDLYTLKGGTIDPRYVGGERIGMRRVSELLRDTIRVEHRLEISLFEADQMVRATVAGQSPAFYTSRGEVDVTTLVQQALDNNFAALINFTEGRLGNARQFPHLLFTGGQMQAMKTRLEAHFPHGQFLDITANARGLAKFAQRQAVFDI